jgi:hypothetical protein
VGAIMAAIKVKFNGKNFIDTLTNVTNYSQGFIDEVKRNQNKITEKIASTSVNVFYDYLDGLARSHPGMLHHVYEWGQVGDPFARLYELSVSLQGKSAVVSADFLQSDTPSPTSRETFYDKANIMEEGIPLVIEEKDAQVLFFEIEGEEFFRNGPIYIANPGGGATRGSFVRAYNEFYNIYFTKDYLNSIKFYDHFRGSKEYQKNVKIASKSKNATSIGRAAALSWINNAPGERV